MINREDLSINNAIRAFFCIFPMILAYAIGQIAWIVPMGQAGFFISTLPIAKTKIERIIMMFLMIAPGLGFYLIGGNTAEYFWLAIAYALAIGIVCGLLTNFRYLGMVAVAGFIPIYTAGLNSGSSEKAATSFLVFSFTILYCGLITILPVWKGRSSVQPVIDEADRAIMGLKLGLGMAISLGLGLFLSFGKLGWAPSAVGSVIRADSVISKKRSVIRAAGVIGGAIVASIAIAYIPNELTLIMVVVILTVINGFVAFTKFGQIPLLYNAVILILYSYTSTTPTGELINTRILYNLLGIMIALAVVFYPLPRVTPRIKAFYKDFSKPVRDN